MQPLLFQILSHACSRDEMWSNFSVCVVTHCTQLYMLFEWCVLFTLCMLQHAMCPQTRWNPGDDNTLLSNHELTCSILFIILPSEHDGIMVFPCRTELCVFCLPMVCPCFAAWIVRFHDVVRNRHDLGLTSDLASLCSGEGMKHSLHEQKSNPSAEYFKQAWHCVVLEISPNSYNSKFPNRRLVRFDSSLNLLIFPFLPNSATMDSVR